MISLAEAISIVNEYKDKERKDVDINRINLALCCLAIQTAKEKERIDKMSPEEAMREMAKDSKERLRWGK